MTIKAFAKKVKAMLTKEEREDVRRQARSELMGWGEQAEDWGSRDLKKG